MQVAIASDKPICRNPMFDGWNRTSGMWKRSFPIVRTCSDQAWGIEETPRNFAGDRGGGGIEGQGEVG